ncbi:Delta(8)-fatty-acid desaturase (Delta(8)-sphingolipid desaturase) (Sphingolipid 8-(E/Z)-desaturase) [Durusdinium trenchii]|uniref:Delta(8)-fatty-acid desaturase (Delta(8)-sphingolipid desaturase) (Sphingolipid 8-(E/Z)-desaturase) n=1 Tax=Durusdinium trenchii TaxID=1381693 RepID=A0ABP0KM93_9DINO
MVERKASGDSTFSNELKDGDGFCHSGSAVSVVAVACGILLAGRLSLETLMWMGCISISRKTALTLAALASLSYVVCGPLLQKTPLTNRLGKMLVARVLNARQNWELDTLRSFCEVSIWLLVVWSTYVGTEGGCFGLVAALTLGTAAGAALVVLGELLQQPLRNLERVLRETSAKRARARQLEEDTFASGNIVLLVLFGPTALSTIYENCSDLMVLASMLVLGGSTILVAARLCQAWKPTRHLGTILQARILNTPENWRQNPARSALESTFFTAVVWGVYELHGDALFALQTGFLSGMSIVIASEVFAHGINFEVQADDSQQMDTSVRPVILGYLSFMVFVCVYAQGHQAVNSAALSVIINSLLWVIMGRCSVNTGVLKDLGMIVNKRALEAAENWTKFPVRSAAECAAWLSGQYLGHCFDSTFAGAVCGITAGVAAVLCSEAVQALLSSEVASTPKPKAGGSPEREWSWEEVEKHTSTEDAWLVIDGRVYDVTDFAPRHPGGPVIFKFVGVDASDQFAAFHRPRVYGRLQQFLVGQVIDDDKHLPSKATADYRALRKRLWREGWFAPDLSFYVNKAIVCVLLFALAIGLVTLEAPTWKLLRTLLAGAVLGIAWQQVAFMAHDADHYGITTPRSGASFNPLAWFLASVLFGISRCMWNEEHSLHHAITLRPQEDPQFNYLPIWLISKKELDVPGTKVDFLTRTLVSVQHYTFLPLSVVIGRFNFYIISMLAALKRLLTAKRFREAYGGLMDVTGMVLLLDATLVKQLDASWERVAFVLVSNWTVGILHIQLVLSHLATETFTAEEEREEQFFTFQLKTSRNIDCDWYDHWFHGGLEFQIEHHLFPQLPRHNLQKVKPLVQEICQRHGIQYRSTSFSKALLEVLRDFQGLALEIVNLRMG